MAIGRIGSVSTEILVHENDTTNVHGIVDTSLVVTTTGSQTLTNKSLTSPTITGTPTAPTAAADTNTTQVATTAYVIGQASSTSPNALGSAAVGTSNRYARADHTHPTTGVVLNGLIGANNGVASLDSTGQVPASQLGNASGGATGGGTDEVFYENQQTVTTNYTITSSRNALSAGPLTIGTGVTVTVPSGSVWAIV